MADPMAYEEGEILEDGEIADDDDDIFLPTSSKSASKPAGFASGRQSDSFEKENHENENGSEASFRSTSSENSSKTPNMSALSSMNSIHMVGKSSTTSPTAASKHGHKRRGRSSSSASGPVKRTKNGHTSANGSSHSNRSNSPNSQAGGGGESRRSFGRQKKREERIAKNKYKAPCKFYMDGKCQKGAACTFSHDFDVPKKEDVCKYYLQGNCQKGDQCNFMHGSFPCKFFHTGVECYKDDKCRFSHAPLDDKSKSILDNYLKNNGRESFDDEQQQQWNRPPHNDEFDSDDSDAPFVRHHPDRPTILGPVPEHLRHSRETWKWQQEMIQMRNEYTGTKYNLYNINSKHILHSEPPESDEAKEARLRATLSEDDFDDYMCVKEIRNHELEQMHLQEQERILVASAALDVDLRKRTRDQTYTIPPVFGIDMSFLNKFTENGTRPLPVLPQYAPPPPPPPPQPQPPPQAQPPPVQAQPNMNSIPQSQPLPGPIDPRMSMGPAHQSLDPRMMDPRMEPMQMQQQQQQMPLDPRTVMQQQPIQSHPPVDPRTMSHDPRNMMDPRSMMSRPNMDPRSLTSPPMPIDPRTMSQPQIVDPRMASVSGPILSPVMPPQAMMSPQHQQQPTHPMPHDPRLNPSSRLIDPRMNRSTPAQMSPTSVMSRQTSLEDTKGPRKPFVKVYTYSPTTYQLRPTVRSKINYQAYEELYRSSLESGSKTDPRLEKFFADIKPVITRSMSLGSPEKQCQPPQEENKIKEEPVNMEELSVEQMIQHKLASIKKSSVFY